MAFHKHRGKKKAQKFVSHKIRKIKKEGVRGKKVSTKQAIAIALSMARKKGLKVSKNKGNPRFKVAIHKGKKV
jgi:hypothetical protein